MLIAADVLTQEYESLKAAAKSFRLNFVRGISAMSAENVDAIDVG